jgi:hypothetical protein
VRPWLTHQYACTNRSVSVANTVVSPALFFALDHGKVSGLPTQPVAAAVASTG